MWVVQYADPLGHHTEHAINEATAASRVDYLRTSQRITQVCYFEIADEGNAA